MSENEAPKFDFKLLGIGISAIIGGIIVGSVAYFSWTRSGEVYIFLPIAAVAALVLGLGAVIKAIGGDSIEWD